MAARHCRGGRHKSTSTSPNAPVRGMMLGPIRSVKLSVRNVVSSESRRTVSPAESFVLPEAWRCHTAAMRAQISSISASFRIKSAVPLFSDGTQYSLYELRMSTGISAFACRIRSNTSRPLRPGIRKSSSTRSGEIRWKVSQASSPLYVVTTS